MAHSDFVRPFVPPFDSPNRPFEDSVSRAIANASPAMAIHTGDSANCAACAEVHAQTKAGKAGVALADCSGCKGNHTTELRNANLHSKRQQLDAHQWDECSAFYASKVG